MRVGFVNEESRFGWVNDESMIDGLITRCTKFDVCTGFCGKLANLSYIMKSWFFSRNIFSRIHYSNLCKKSLKIAEKKAKFSKQIEALPPDSAVGWGLHPPPPPDPRWLWLCYAQVARFARHFSLLPKFPPPPPLQRSASVPACIDYSDTNSKNKCTSLPLWPTTTLAKKKNGHLDYAEIRTLFLSWDIEKPSMLSQRCSNARSRATGIKVMLTRHYMILRDKNSILILCIIQVVVFFFFFWPG